MLNKLPGRMQEPSTAAGAGLVGFGLNDMALDPATVSQGVDLAAAALPVLLAPTPMGLLSLALGVYAMFKPEKGAK